MNEGLVASAVDCLTLKAVFLHSSQLKLHPDFDQTRPAELELQSRISLKSVAYDSRIDETSNEATSYVRAYVEAGVRLNYATKEAQPLAEGEDKIKVAVELVAVFVADYALSAERSPLEGAVPEFMKHNAVFHVWAYWREYVQSTFSRAMLPAVTLPMLVVRPTPSKEIGHAQSAEESS